MATHCGGKILVLELCLAFLRLENLDSVILLLRDAQIETAHEEQSLHILEIPSFCSTILGKSKGSVASRQRSFK
jgi:hypothetical protein